MNMKKTIAAVAACAVAVSAVATTVASAAEEVSVTYNLVRNVTVEGTGSVTFTATIDYSLGIDEGGYVQIGFKPTSGNINLDDVAFSVTGWNFTSAGTKGDTFSYVNYVEGQSYWTLNASSQVKKMDGMVVFTIPAAATGIEVGQGFRATVNVTTTHTGSSWNGADLSAEISYGVGTGLADLLVTDKSVGTYHEDSSQDPAVPDTKLGDAGTTDSVVDGATISYGGSNNGKLTEIYAVPNMLINDGVNTAIDVVKLNNVISAWSSREDSTAKYPMQTTANTNNTGAFVRNAGYSSSTYGDVYYVQDTDSTHLRNANGTVSNILAYLASDKTLNGGEVAYVNVIPVINDIIQNYEETTFVFHTAASAIKDGAYSDDDSADKQFLSFGQHLYNYYGDEATGYTYSTSYDWNGYNLFSGALVVNGQLSMSLNDTNVFEYGATTLSFNYNDALDGASVNAYAQYLSKLQLATSTTWYWDSLDVVGSSSEAEDAGTDAGVEADDDVIDDSEDEDVVDDVVEDDDTDVEDDVDVDVDDTDDVDVDVDVDTDADAVDTADTTDTATAANPGTGNAPIALAVIPVALAAAAVVAKKRG